MRLIDADDLTGQMKDRLRCCNNGSVVEACFLGIVGLIKSAPTITPPPNNPLTLDELREMDGEPVWVKSLDKDYGEWVIARTIELEGICLFTVVGATHQYGENGTMDGYGKTWLAYRRRQEVGS